VPIIVVSRRDVKAPFGLDSTANYVSFPKIVTIFNDALTSGQLGVQSVSSTRRFKKPLVKRQMDEIPKVTFSC